MYEKLLINANRKLEYIKIENKKIDKQNGLLIKNLYCGICSSDLKIIKKGHPALKYPRVPGHEIIGKIEKIGDSFNYLKKQGLKEGDIVQVYPGITCGNCKYCKTGRYNLCESIKIIGFNYDGGFSSYSYFPEKTGLIHLTKIKSKNDIYIYSIAEPLASCINVFSNIPIYFNDTLVIIGAGFMGQLLTITAHYFGIKKQFILDFNFKNILKQIPSNPEMIKITSSNEISKINEINPDIVIIATSDFTNYNELFEAVSKGSRICYFSGISQPSSLTDINFNHIHYKELHIRGFYGSTPAQNKKAIDIINKFGNFFKTIINKRIYPLYEYKKALKNAYSHKYPKVIFEL